MKTTSLLQRLWLTNAFVSVLIPGIFTRLPANGAPPPQSPLTLETIYSFPAGQSPSGGALRSTNGNFFVTTSGAGTNGFGGIYAITPGGAAGTPFYFNGANGASPAGPLLQGNDGNLYGVTSGGGISNNGTVFKISQLLTSNSLTTLVRFNGTNGSNPQGSLALATNGFLFGATYAGGSNGLGAIFGVTTSGTFSNFHSFTGTDGQNPASGLVVDRNHNLYGTTRYGGTSGLGTIFVITPSGRFTNLFSFDGANGADPRGVILGTDGNFYGSTFAGGSDDLGAIFSMTPSGSLNAVSLNIHEGTNPDGPLVQGGDGAFYGTTLQGGTYGVGAAFQFAVNARVGRRPFGTILNFVPFAGNAGANPSGGLTSDGNGNFFGTTISGGDNNAGTLFELTGFVPVVTRAPTNVPFVINSTATFRAGAAGSGPLAFQWLLNGVPLSDQTLSGVTITGSSTPTLQIGHITAADVGTYTLIISNEFGLATNTSILSVPPPTLAIKPVIPLTVTTPTLAISGTTADRNLPVTGVQFRLGNSVSAATSMNQFSNFTGTLTLQPGSNYVQIYSLDQLGNSSKTNTYTVFYYVTNSLVLITNGPGTIVTPRGFDPNALVVGKTYRLTAVPARGYLFSNWTGSITSSSPTINFLMTTNATLTANFVTNIFTGTAGVYDGLFSENGGITPGTAGMLSGLSINSAGAYSGKLLISGKSYPISGLFSLAGGATNTISRAAGAGGPIRLEMFLVSASTPASISGAVSSLDTNSSQWTASLVAVREGNNAPSAEYTMLLPVTLPPAAQISHARDERGDAGATVSTALTDAAGGPPVPSVSGIPAGAPLPVADAYGYALLTNHAGTLTLSGALPDGAAFAQTVIGSRQNGIPRFPIYCSLDAGRGVLTGWLNLSEGAPSGELTWSKPAIAGTLLFTNGITNTSAVIGSLWTNPPAKTPAVVLTNGVLSVSNGFLQTPLVYSVSVNNLNLLVASAGPANSLSGSINPKNGLLKISFGNGAGKSMTVGQGAVLQEQSFGAGFFLTKTNAGQIELEEAP
jgi:uncharacterized repeat protein (TIGR03803 family)